MATLFFGTESRPVSVFGRFIPSVWIRWLARLWLILIVVGSLLPGPAKVQLGTMPAKPAHGGSRVTMQHRLMHGLAFGSAWLLVSFLTVSNREALLAAGEVLAVGFLIELAQDIVYSHGKTFEWWDIRDDALGIGAVFATVLLARWVRRHF